MGEYLEARGRRVDVVFGLLRPGALALVAVDLFMEAVTLPADDVGVVRCRLAGRSAALVDVDGGHSLDVAGLARVWPKLVAELFERAGQEDARALLASPTLVRPLEALKEILVENEVHADALYDLGRGPLGPRLASVARAEVPDRWSSLLSSRPLRLAWAASVLLLLGAHASVPSSAPLPARRAARDARDGEVLPLVTLPRLDDRLLPAPREASR